MVSRRPSISAGARFLLRALALAPALVLVAPAAAEPWRLTGSNVLRLDSFQVRGDEERSPYPHEGVFLVNDLNLSLSGDTAPGQSWRVDVGGTFTDSPYRSRFDGFVPEWLYISHENRTAALPFRLELGDQEVALSPLTMQRYLKAGRITLHPQAGRDGRRYHLTAFVGADQSSWRDFEADENLYQGLGVAMQDSALGDYGFNVVRNSRDNGSQWVASATGFKGFTLGAQRLELSGELAYLQGEQERRGRQQRLHGHGLNLQLDGRHQGRPLDYRLRFDRYSRDFRPHGGSVPADSRSMAAEAGWKYASGAELRGRVQRIEERVSTDNSVRTDGASVQIAGPLRELRPQASGRAELQVQRRRNARGTVQARSIAMQAGVGVEHGPRHRTDVDVALARVENHGGHGDRTSKRIAVRHQAKVSVKGLDLSLSPSVVYEEARGPRGRATVGPGLALEAGNDRHRLRLQLGRGAFEAEDASRSADHERVSLGYEYRRGQHRVGVEIERSLRDPAEGESSDAVRAGVYWRYDFDRTFGD